MLPSRDPSDPTSSGLCTSRGSRPHGDASRSIPAGSQCGDGGGDGGTILRPGLSALRPRPSPPAHSATPRGAGCPAPAPKAGRLDPGPLWPAGPLLSPPRGPASTHKVSACFGALTGPHALCPRRWGEASRLALLPPGPAPRPKPRRLAPNPKLGCGSRPFPPHRKCPSAASFPRWLAPRPL